MKLALYLPNFRNSVTVKELEDLTDLAEELEHAVAGLKGDRDRDLVVWASMTVAETVLPGWLVRLGQRQAAEGRPPTTVSLTAGNSRQVVEAVLEGRAHLGDRGNDGGRLPHLRPP